MKDFERITEWTPAYDKRDPDPSKNYGIHGMNLRFVLKGPKGATQFVIYTNWQLPHVRYEWNETPKAHLVQPMAADLGYHAYEPQYEGQTAITEECPYLDGAPCYYDGSSLRADKLFDLFVTEGDEAMWEYLESEYRIQFEHHNAMEE